MACSSPPQPTSHEAGLIKVRLIFKTWKPLHRRSFALKSEYAAKPPFLEDVCVWMHPSDVLPELNSFEPAFQVLRDEGIVPAETSLTDFVVLLNDLHTLAYRTEEP